MPKFVCVLLVLVLVAAGNGYEHGRGHGQRHLGSDDRKVTHNDNDKHRYRLELKKEPRKPNGFDSLFGVPILNAPPRHRLLRLSATVANRSHRNQPHASPDLKLPRSPKSTAFGINVDLLKAEEHRYAMQSRTRCASPREHVVCVKDLYPDTDVKYHPACTLLHRCDGSSGCCVDPLESCQAHHTGQVVLYFRSNIDSEVLKLPFTNHTSCRCRRTHRDLHVVHSTSTASTSEAEDDYDIDEGDPEENALGDCPRCPKPFSKRLMRGVCHCDCFNSDVACLAIKSGKEALTNAERKCVHSRVCQKPRCDEGTHFDLNLGECRKPDDTNDEYLGDNDDDDDDDDDIDDDSDVQREQQQQQAHKQRERGDASRENHSRRKDY